MLISIIISFIGAILAPNPLVAYAALVQVTNFGNNPSGALMHINVPSKLATNPAVVLAVRITLLPKSYVIKSLLAAWLLW
jgi:hypothetical protein